MNVSKFNGIMAEKGITREWLSREIGLYPSTFYRKLARGGDSFSIGEIKKMISKIPLTEKEAINIFLK